MGDFVALILALCLVYVVTNAMETFRWGPRRYEACLYVHLVEIVEGEGGAERRKETKQGHCLDIGGESHQDTMLS